ncbi:hypothetical protein GGF32_002630 [Allomyces javanicus]|nr:hypothetical protein GGF32_002630 [Allomyces javanicus]
MFGERTLATTMAHASEILSDYGAYMDKMVEKARIALSLIGTGIPLSHLVDAIRDNIHEDPRVARLWLAKQPLKEDPRVLKERINALQHELDATKQQKEALKQELDTIMQELNATTQKNDAITQELDAATQRNDALSMQVQQLQNPQPDATGRVLIRARHGDYIAKTDDGRLDVADLATFQRTMVSERAMTKEFAKIKAQVLYPHATVPKLAPFPHQGTKTAVQAWIWNIKNALSGSNHDRLLDLDPVAWAKLFPKMENDDELANACDGKVRQALLMAMGDTWGWSYSKEFRTTVALFGFIERTYARMY